MSDGSFTTNREELYGELFNVYRQFLPYCGGDGLTVVHRFEAGENPLNFVSVNGENFFFAQAPFSCVNKVLERRIELRQMKLALYKALKGTLNRSLAWGALTGVRPTKLAYEMLREGNCDENIAKLLFERYLVSEQKAQLVKRVVANQKGIYTNDSGKVNFYVHIPFCPTRCYYCSFVAVPLAKQKHLLDGYVDKLIEDIKRSVGILSRAGKEVLSVYIGGGTPSVLSAPQLEAVLSAVPYRDVEYTFEAGRPDTVTDEKAELMKRYGVTRVSVNPQTLNDRTLRLIGREHTAEQFYEAFKVMRSRGFLINTDLIAGLEGEDVQDFKFSVNALTESLRPENITVHTLSAKNGSSLKENLSAGLAELSGDCIAEEMTDYAYSYLSSSGYEPYYLYRQKNMLANLENTGYCLKGTQCVNNITVMEECVGVMACGSGAISKRLFNGGERIERYAQVKDVKQYIGEFERRFEKKEQFWLSDG